MKKETEAWAHGEHLTHKETAGKSGLNCLHLFTLPAIRDGKYLTLHSRQNAISRLLFHTIKDQFSLNLAVSVSFICNISGREISENLYMKERIQITLSFTEITTLSFLLTKKNFCLIEDQKGFSKFFKHFSVLDI